MQVFRASGILLVFFAISYPPYLLYEIAPRPEFRNAAAVYCDDRTPPQAARIASWLYYQRAAPHLRLFAFFWSLIASMPYDPDQPLDEDYPLIQSDLLGYVTH